MEYKVTEQQLNAILDYLGRKPYGEVYQLIGMIHTVVQPPVLEKKDESPKSPR